MAVSDDVYKAAMKFRKRLIGLEKKAHGEIQSVYGDVIRNTVPFVQNYLNRRVKELAEGVDPHDAGGVANREKVDLIRRLELEFYKASSAVSQTTIQGQIDAMDLAHSQAYKLAYLGSPDPTEVSVSWKKPSFDALRNLVGFAGDGRPLDTYFQSKLPAAGAKAVQEALYLSTLLNEPPVQAAKRIKGAVAGNAWRAETIARTEILRTHRETTRQNFLENDDVVMGYQWLAARDSRSCIVCWTLSGKIFKTKEPFGTHVNCRCTLSPITDPEDLKDIPSGAEEFKQLSQDEQQDILGIPKWTAWKEGNLPLENLIGFRKHPIFGPIRWERGLKDALKGEIPGAIPPQPKSLKPKPPKREKKAPDPEPAPIPAPPQQPLTAPRRPAGTFPFETELGLLEPVRKLGGSTGAELVKDANGELWVRKHGASADHIRSEIAADNIYRAMGVNVPEAKLYETDKGPVKLARFIEGETLDKLKGTRRSDAILKLRDGFAADAILGNWDVVGLNSDNILIDKKGEVWRIDNGGALKYRAQGGLKQEFNQYPLEFWSMRDQTRNSRLSSNVLEAFGDVHIFELSQQIRKLQDMDQAKIKAEFPPDIRATLEGRLQEAYRLNGHLEALKYDKWKAEYVEQVGFHALNLRAKGVIDNFPKELNQKAGHWDQTVVFDEHGKEFDHLRGDEKGFVAIDDYFKGEANLDLGIIQHWQQAQAGNSWSFGVQAFKHFIATEARTAPHSEYFWHGTADIAKKRYEEGIAKVGKDAYFQSHAAYKALVMEFLQTTDFGPNDQKKKQVRLIRTEDEAVMAAHGFQMQRGGSGEKRKLQRGASESFSIYTKVTVKGSKITIQDVPHARIHGVYFLGRKRGWNGGSFASDGENEFAALWHDQEVEWHSKLP